MPSLLETTLSMYRTAFKLLRSVGFFRLPIQYQEMASTEMQSFSRLPTDVVPHHYDITLSLNLKSFIFNGNESVHVNVKKATDTIVINSLDIDIKNALFICNDGNTIATKKVDISTPKETATLIFDDKLPVGRTGYLSLEFEGEINDKMKGLYRSKYIGQDGSVKYAAVTQFEATDARCCFPCWDEPAHKATFDITLKVPSGLTALSNMPVKSKVTNDATETIAFETTPIMSTYLVAVVVGEFDYIEDTSSDGVLVRVYTPKSKTEQGQFALETAVKVLPYYKDYFGISYPLPKIDLIAIADFSSGAMENWGLVTYRETCLLVDPQNTSAFRKQRIALVVAHELAHQWFGNLVTMEWWTHLWLNEGYASFVEFLCVAHLYPEYGIWTQFVTSELIGALELDALQNSHAIEVPVDHPSEINEIFDEISYSKGACVIRMLHRYIGDDDFRKGMNLYLNRHSYGNARTADLWHALEDVSDKNVGKVMSMWTEQQGFPVVRVRHRQDGNDRILTLTQERFLASGDWQLNELWMIPISVSTSKNPDKCVLTDLLDEKTKEFRIKDVSPDSWVIVNPGKVGFYRTYYSQDALALLLPAVKDRTLPPLDRLSLFDDMFAVAQTGRVSTVEALQLLLAFQKEDNFTVWSSIVNVLRKIVFLLSHLESLDAFKAFGRNILRDICNELGWDPKPNESHCDTLLRSIVLNHMVGLNDAETIEEAKKRFELHLTRKAILPADLRRSVYRAVLSDGDKEAYQTILRLHREADLHEEKDRILRSLGAMKDEALLAEALEFAMSDEVRAQDAVYAIMSVSMSYKGRLMAWEFVKKHWQTLRDRYGGGFLMSRLVKVITENFVTEKQAQEVEQFFKEHSMLGIERTVQQCVESIRLNEEWLSRDLESIEEFLAKQQVK